MKHTIKKIREAYFETTNLDELVEYLLQEVDEVEKLKDQIALLVEDLETIERMPFNSIEETMEFASDSLTTHKRLI